MRKHINKTSGRQSLAKDERGGTEFIEKLIMIAFIAFVVLWGAKYFGKSVKDKYKSQADSITNEIPSSPSSTGSNSP